MKKYLISIFITLLLISCSDDSFDNSFITSSIDEDFSSIQEPRERWEAYKLKDYAIDQNWACECVPPVGCTSYIINNAVIDVKYNISKDSYYGRSEAEIYKQTINTAMTIDEAFELIERYKASAYKVEVEFHKRFGYPTKIFINIDSLMVDEEIIRSFDNLQKINK